jgi:2-phospho-L-lactate guanylyltransferase
VQVAVVVPVRAFSDAKQRLASVLGASDRAALARRLATNVVRAAGSLPVYVVCDDDEVAEWARDHRATVLWRPAAGLNDAVTFGVEVVAEGGYSDALVAHGDLPHARDLTVVTGFDGVTLVPDRHEDGTNVICLPVTSGFRFAYGPGSFARHQAEAERAGLPLRVVRDHALSWDVDVPADLVDDPSHAPVDR